LTKLVKRLMLDNKLARSNFTPNLTEGAGNMKNTLR